MTLDEMKVAYPEIVEELVSTVRSEAEQTALTMIDEQSHKHSDEIEAYQAQLAELSTELETARKNLEAQTAQYTDISNLLERYMFSEWLHEQMSALPAEDCESEAGKEFAKQMAEQGPANRDAITLAIQAVCKRCLKWTPIHRAWARRPLGVQMLQSLPALRPVSESGHNPHSTVEGVRQ